MLRTERHGGVLRLTLDRPDVLNAFNLDMARALQAALDDAAADATIRAVVLTGSGRGFCAGQDLASVPMGEGQPRPDLGDVVKAQYNPIVTRLRALEKPVVCAVNGVAAGAGANIAFACDIVLASSEASFIQSFTKIGLVPDSGGTWLLPRLVGLARASSLMLLGEKITAAQARDLGLVWKVCAADTLLDDAMALAGQLATQPTRAFALTKRLLNASFDHDLATQLNMEESLQREAGHTADFVEGVQAFRQKRAPVFEGR
ncbi:MAG: 2-(1,2-epoxy-1,2-dihydrophenyl)acetyl-CoA isomerase [Gemmatimonadaceae bacterium]|nr:2-(1,2-epoxy-1,2-dihydrophenyl)acetyl-CoA isomerase [Gemmatimonadaceae bacterium]